MNDDFKPQDANERFWKISSSPYDPERISNLDNLRREINDAHQGRPGRGE
jgi:hypothetical protein